MPDPTTWKQALYPRAEARPDELALAAHARHGGWPEAEDLEDFVDFYVLEWVDAEGWTEVDRAVAEGVLPPEAARWSAEVRTALWVVDGWEGPLVLLRDVATEAEVAVHAPGAEVDLPRRSVLKARVLPWEDRQVFSGAPAVYGPMGVIARMDLLRTWQEGPEPALLERLTRLRAAFRRQREEREAFVALFGADLVVHPDADALAHALERLADHLHEGHRFASLGGRTRAEAWRAERGVEPARVGFAPGPTLTGPGRHAVVYDAVEGVHFLPAYGELLAHLRGEADHPEVLARYLDDPGLGTLPFRRAGMGPVLRAALGATDEADAWARLEARKPRGRAAPSVLPSFDDEGA